MRSGPSRANTQANAHTAAFSRAGQRRDEGWEGVGKTEMKGLKKKKKEETN